MSSHPYLPADVPRVLLVRVCSPCAGPWRPCNGCQVPVDTRHGGVFDGVVKCLNCRALEEMAEAFRLLDEAYYAWSGTQMEEAWGGTPALAEEEDPELQKAKLRVYFRMIRWDMQQPVWQHLADWK